MDYPRNLAEGEAMCHFFAENFQHVGALVQCRPLLLNDLLESITSGKADLSFFSMTLDFPDVEYFVNAFESSSAFNMSHYQSAVIDELLQKARLEPDKSNRAVVYKQINEILYNDAVTLNISYPKHISYRHRCLQELQVNVIGDSYVNYAAVSLQDGCERTADFYAR